MKGKVSESLSQKSHSFFSTYTLNMTGRIRLKKGAMNTHLFKYMMTLE